MSSPEEKIWLVIVGGGIHGLCLLLRLVETVLCDGIAESDLSAGEWRQRVGRWEYGKRMQHVEKLLDSVVVVDQTGKWCGRWRDAMDLVGVSHLRSTLHLHLDPSSRDSLLSFLLRTKRFPSDCRELETTQWTHANPTNASSKSDRSAQFQHLLPSVKAFNDHIDDLINQGVFSTVNRVLQKGTVESISRIRKNDETLFQVQLEGPLRKSLFTQHVVHAVGPLNVPRIPDWAEGYEGNDICHIWDLLKARQEEVPGQLNIAEAQHITVVGSGLTAVQFCKKLAGQNKQVVLIAKKKLRAQQFDTDYSWYGPRGVAKLSHFHQATPEERLKMITASRHGGTVNPRLLAELRKHQNIVVFDGQDVKCAESGQLVLQSGKKIAHDKVVLCTGAKCSVLHDRLLSPLLSQTDPARVCKELPILEPTLAWPFQECTENEGNLYVMGALAQLALGPTALNIDGARRGAARIVQDLYSRYQVDEDLHHDPWISFTNPFELLQSEDDSDSYDSGED